MKFPASLFNRSQQAWQLYESPVQIIQTQHCDRVIPCLRLIEEVVEQEHLHAVGFLSYEAAPAFDNVLVTKPLPDLPLLWFGLYQAPQLAAESPSAYLGSYAIGEWVPTVGRNEYDRCFAAIKGRIARGDTYQVNYTMRLRSNFSGDSQALFRDLLHSQPADYAAYLDIGDHAICSVSPELFFTLADDNVICRPMKGTRKRGRYPAEDAAFARELLASEKERAENVMVVDMIRNDLGRIAEFGGVQVPELFIQERYPTVWQLTSTVRAKTRASVVEILTGLFPCASVTGPPKPSTMRIIEELESTPRGIYTGCIGYIAPGRRAHFNVAIRTAVIDRKNSRIEYGVGGGIVWDSRCGDEHDECLLKAQVLNRRQPEFDLLETILWQPETDYCLLDRHLQRLCASADYFGWAVERSSIESRLDEFAATLTERPYRIRLLVSKDGEISCQSAPSSARDRIGEPLIVRIAARPIDSSDPFLFHKTTNRQVYDRAVAESAGCDDVILWNERNEVTESTIANVVVEIDGVLTTPPIACGLLAGTFREELLARGKIIERVITVDEIRSATNIFLVNSVRGWMPVRLAEVSVEANP